jgi:hypothetical protein
MIIKKKTFYLLPVKFGPVLEDETFKYEELNYIKSVISIEAAFKE